MKHHGVAVLGATGSIGHQVIEIIREFPERFELVAVTAGTDVAGVARLKAQHRDTYGAVAALPEGRSEPPKGSRSGRRPSSGRQPTKTRTWSWSPSADLPPSGRQWPRLKRTKTYPWPARRRWSSP